MSMVQTSIDDELLAAVDRAAAALNVMRAAFVRQALQLALQPARGHGPGGATGPERGCAPRQSQRPGRLADGARLEPGMKRAGRVRASSAAQPTPNAACRRVQQAAIAAARTPTLGR